MCLQMQGGGYVDSTTVLSGTPEHWHFQQAFYMDESAEIENLELFGTDFCRQLLPQFLLFDPKGGD